MILMLCVVAAECRPTWIIRNNTHSVGATLIVQPIQAVECLSRCAMTASCVAVDLLTSCTPPQCWMHHSRNNLRQRYRGVNVTQYEVATRCATIAPPVSGCQSLITGTSSLQSNADTPPASFTKLRKVVH